MHVHVAAQVVHPGLQHVLDDGVATHRVAVDGEVADGHLALVAGGEHHPAELVRQRHQRGATDAALQVLLGEVGRAAVERRGEHVEVRSESRLDGHRAVVDAEALGEVGGVGSAVVAGVAAGHADAVHVLGAEGVDGHAGHDRGVDTARQADDHIGEAVLAHVVAGAEHQRRVELGIGRERLDQPRLDDARGEARLLADGDERQVIDGGAATGVDEPLAIHGFNDDVGDEQFGGELRCPRHECALVVEHHRAAVEDQFVLAAHLIHVDERTAGVGGAGGEHALAVVRLAVVERRSVDVDVQLGTTGGLLGQRPGGAPHVFADAHRHFHPADDEQLVRVVGVARGEVAGLVEHGVVGQHPLAIRAHHGAVHAHRSRVVEVAVGIDEAHHCGAVPRVRGDGGERVLVVGHEAGLQHEVFRRIAGDGQFGEGHDVAARCLGLVVGGLDERHVAVEIADGWVDLGEGDAQAGHAPRLLGPHALPIRERIPPSSRSRLTDTGAPCAETRHNRVHAHEARRAAGRISRPDQQAGSPGSSTATATKYSESPSLK